MVKLITKEEFQQICNSSNSKKEALFKLGHTGRAYESGFYYKKFDNYVNNFNIDLTTFNKNCNYRKSIQSSAITPIRDILQRNISYMSSSFKRRLFQENLLINKCYECGQIDAHNGKPLTLQLDHINGNRHDNNLENLRILCPNCHSQTITYGGRNKKNPNRGQYKKQIRAKQQNLSNWRDEYEKREKAKIPLVENADIDFSKFGWVVRVAPIIKKSHQKVKSWMKQFMPDFYENECFKKIKRTAGVEPATSTFQCSLEQKEHGQGCILPTELCPH